MNIAVITARGGSKRIPHKNIRDFGGKPMIAWPIFAARESGVFDRVIVSTDSDRIAGVAREFGAEVPFMRPPELSDEHTATAPVVLHAVEWLARHGQRPERVCCIYPTSPFILADDLRSGLELLKRGAPAAIAVTTFDFPILRAFKVADDGGIEFNWPEYRTVRSQDLPEFYHDAGQFYWARVEDFMREKRFAMPGARPIVLPRKRVQDLDTPEDWEVAELMWKAVHMGE